MSSAQAANARTAYDLVWLGKKLDTSAADAAASIFNDLQTKGLISVHQA